MRTISDGDTLTLALQAGEIDAAYGLPYISYPLFENEDYVFTSTATSRVFFGIMNMQSARMQDPVIRQAIAMGIDKERFTTQLLSGNGVSATGPFPKYMRFGKDAVQAEAYDPEKAKELLTQAGWIDQDDDGLREKDGEKLTIRWLTYPSRQELPILAQSAQATLREIGMKVEINCTADHQRLVQDPASWDVYFSAMVTSPTGDPFYFFQYYCLDSSVNNDGHYHNDQLEVLTVRMQNTFDIEARAQLAIEMQQLILDDCAYLFCSHLRMSMVAKSNVSGLVAHPCDYYEITVDLKKE